MHPLSLFPNLFFLSPLSATLLRVTVALTIAYVARAHVQRREEIAATSFMLIGKPGVWFTWLVIALESVLALALFFGYYTQLAALAGMIMSIKHYVLAKKYPRAIPLCRADYVFIFIMCLSLLLTGAGAFAFDLPL